MWKILRYDDLFLCGDFLLSTSFGGKVLLFFYYYYYLVLFRLLAAWSVVPKHPSEYLHSPEGEGSKEKDSLKYQPHWGGASECIVPSGSGGAGGSLKCNSPLEQPRPGQSVGSP